MMFFVFSFYILFITVKLSEQVCNSYCVLCSGDVCSQCEEGYYLDQSTICNRCSPSGCTCNKRDECSGCVDGYYLNSIYSFNYCGKCNNGCKTCTSFEVCISCNEGYYFNSGSCFSCPVGCTVCNTGGQCTECVSGYYLYNDQCYQCGNGCRTCTDSLQCTSCIDGYNLTNGQCYLCGNGCTACTELRCYHCQSGYSLVNGICCAPGCSACDTQGNCLGCNDGYSLSSGVCSQCLSRCTGCASYHCCSVHCTSCGSNGYCASCADGYYFDNSQCYTCPSGCKVCISSNVCTECVDGYTLNGGICCALGCTSCYTSGSCTGCSTGYYLISGTCKHCQPECTVCTGHNQCSDCVNGYYLLNGQCSYCGHGYYIANGACNPCQIGCKTCTGSRQCSECLTGYVLSDSPDGICCPPTCTSCLSVNDCTSCIGGYHGSDCGNTCSRNCLTNVCDKDTGSCTHGCVDGFYGTEECQCPEHCQNDKCDNGTSYCSEGCKTGFYGIKCSATCPERCLNNVCSADIGDCTFGCKDGYHGISGCPCPENCKNEECDRTTKQCRDGCVDGYFGDQCNVSCPVTCTDMICQESRGSCNGCKGSSCSTGGVTNSQSSGTGDASSQSNLAGPVSGAVIGFLVAAVLAVGLFLLWHRRKRLNQQSSTQNSNTNDSLNKQVVVNVNGTKEMNTDVPNPRVTTSVYDKLPVGKPIAVPRNEIQLQTFPGKMAEEEDIEEPKQETCISLPSGSEGEVNSYYNIGVITRSVRLEELAVYAGNKSDEKYMEEFLKLPKGLQKPHNDSRKPENIRKNRYKGIYPYDETRVVLADGGPDYINASYLDGYEAPKFYIAALGPTPATVQDIWRMVWQERIGKIVMLTREMENLVKKCAQYWPDKCSTMDAVGMSITSDAEELYAEFIVRKFTLVKNGEQRTVTHLQYTAWPDNGVPDDVTSLVEFRQKVQATFTPFDGPTLVHCSAGIGRTGTYVAVDYLNKEGESEGTVNIMACVLKLREQRVNMVETKNQYIYLHQAVVHSLTFDCKSITEVKFRSHFQELIKGGKDGESLINTQFRQLQETIETKKDLEDSISRNRAQKGVNRFNDIVPADKYRPFLHIDMMAGGTDYINAVYMNSYQMKNGFILTQTPMKSTLVDFCKLIFQEKAPCVVMMDDPVPGNKTTAQYWPTTEEEVKHGNFKISKTKSDDCEGFAKNSLTVQYHKPVGVKEHEFTQFIFKGWDRVRNIPVSSAKLVQFIEEVERVRSHSDNQHCPIIIHCLNGAERSGLYCAVSVLLEKMKTEQEVSVVNTVRTLKFRRRQVIPSLEQYRFCYESVSAYLESVNTYSNIHLR